MRKTNNEGTQESFLLRLQSAAPPTQERRQHEELEEDVGHVEQLGHEVEGEKVAVLLTHAAGPGVGKRMMHNRFLLDK